MKNFGRTLRLVLRYPGTLAASAVCAILVALLWGANIGGMYPIVEIIFGDQKGQTLQTWIDKEIAKEQATLAAIDWRIAALRAQLREAAPGMRGELEAQLAREHADREISEKILARRQWLRPYIYDYLPHGAFQTIVLIVVLVVIGTLLKDVFLVLDAILVDRLTNLTAMELRKKFFRRTLRMELASFSANRTAELTARFTADMDSLHGGIQTLLGRAVREPLKMLACFVGAGWVCWRLLLVSLLVAPAIGYLISRLASSLKRANRRAMEEITQLYSILGETFENIKIVKAFTSERQERRRFHRNSKEIYRRAMKIARYDALVHPLSEMLGVSAISLCILCGAYLVLNQETHLLGIKMSDRPLSWGELLLFYGLLVGATDPARKLSDVFNRLQRAVAASDRIYQMLDREPAIRNAPNPRPLARHHREIVFRDVAFSYTPAVQVLDRINLRIGYGGTIAVVGPNGCGKSTLASLIPRFFDVTAGTVEIDGVDVRQVRLRDLRRQIGIVTQEALLFDDTVYNNIRYGSPHATREEIVEAARQAHAHRFIEQKLERGYETIVGAAGGRLSGGQRQRVALARAMLRNPAILILDEATSQIDIESEQLIHRALEQFVRDRTAILITHRLATLDLADRILVMQAGGVHDIGTHHELISRCELYRRIYQFQFRESA
ncbi:MAG TPA: ABC transporter ATP-binding protein [Pirellulales bacterium]|nr:ABC transporter ATP-binding protein [Pirellulales bacterium]